MKVKAVEGLEKTKTGRAIVEDPLLEEMVPGKNEMGNMEAEILTDARRLLLVSAAQKAQGPRRTIAFNALMA